MGAVDSRKLPEGYVNQHTLWIRKTMNSEDHSRTWRQQSGMIILMPGADERDLHAEFRRKEQYRQYSSGLPLPSQKLAALAMEFLEGLDPEIGRKRQFEYMANHMKELARTTIGRVANEAELYAGHFALQLDHYDRALTAEDERELGLI